MNRKKVEFYVSNNHLLLLIIITIYHSNSDRSKYSMKWHETSAETYKIGDKI